MVTTPAVLIADSISKRFGDRRILTSATLRAHAGELRVLFGRNGAGKSTLLKIAAGALEPDSGVVQFLGEARLRNAQWTLARAGLFYLPDRELFSPSFTVGRQLRMLYERFGGIDPSTVILELGLSSYVNSRPPQLSSGERRRIEFAAVLIRKPKCLLADEPLRGLAPIDRGRVLDALQELRNVGVAIVVTGHETDDLLMAADHVSWVTSGTTYELGPPRAAVQDRRFKSEYLGAPDGMA